MLRNAQHGSGYDVSRLSWVGTGMTAEIDFNQSLAYAETALGQIRSLRLHASPPNYEVWYHYATGHNAALNHAINERLQKMGTLTQADINTLSDAFLNPMRNTQRLDAIGVRVVDEIDQVMSMIDAVIGIASRHGESLAGVSAKLSGAVDRDGLRAIVAALIGSAKEMEHAHRTMEERLHASKQEISRLQESLAAIRSESLTDPLTGLANRKSFDEGLERAIADAVETGQPLSLIMLDIDHFKAFNDNFGHVTGDQVLRLVAKSLQQNIKGQDFAARYGGEEFAVVLPNTNLRQAIAVADHIRRVVMTRELVKRSTGESLGRISISAGIGMWRTGEPPNALIERADTCLYAAKRNGRNRVTCETDPDVTALTDAKVA